MSLHLCLQYAKMWRFLMACMRKSINLSSQPVCQNSLVLCGDFTEININFNKTKIKYIYWDLIYFDNFICCLCFLTFLKNLVCCWWTNMADDDFYKKLTYFCMRKAKKVHKIKLERKATHFSSVLYNSYPSHLWLDLWVLRWYSTVTSGRKCLQLHLNAD